MKRWAIEYTETAYKAFLALGSQNAKRIKKYLDERIATEEDPRRFGESLKANLSGFWKYRIGDFRVIVDIQEEKLVVLVVRVGHRSTVYQARRKTSPFRGRI